MSETTTGSGGFEAPGWLVLILRWIITVGLPLALILINARLLMSNAFLNWEYNRPGFPEDRYPPESDFMSRERRLEYAPLALDYLFNDEGIEFLGDQTFPDGRPLYNERELSHMLDVKIVTGNLMVFGYTLIAALLISIAVMAASPASRGDLLRGLMWGGLLNAALILLGLALVATSFYWLFTQFHNLFFAEGTWVFLYSDTLIRLFPIQFWTDAFALMFGGALAEGLLISGVCWRLLRRG